MKLYVSSIYGNDGNDGSELAPVASLTRALELVTEIDSIIYILDCEVKGGDYVVTVAMNGLQIIGIGTSVLNCTGFVSGFLYDQYFHGAVFSNVQIFGFSEWGFFLNRPTGPTTDFEISFQSCTIFNRGALYDVATIWKDRCIDGHYLNIIFKNTTIYGVRLEGFVQDIYGSYTPEFRFENCIYQSDYVPHVDCVFSAIRVFSNQPLLAEPVEYTLASFPPPFTSSDNEALDLRFDPEHPQFHKYLSAGFNDDVCGNFSRAVSAWTKIGDGVASLSNHVALGVWENDDNTYPTVADSIEITAGVNDRVDFNEGGAELSAILTAQVYANAAALATEIAIKMDALATATITSYVGTIHKVVIASDGATFNLLWATGTNTAINAGLVCGFDDSEDDTAQTLYVADGIPNSIGGGAATLALVDSGQIVADRNSNDIGAYAIAVSPILDFKAPKKLERVYLTFFVEGDSTINTSAWADIVITAASNDKIDFNEGAGELTATIAAATYATGVLLAAAIETALNAVAVATITVEYTVSRRIEITSDGATFELPWNTGTNNLISAKTTLGFADTDLSGAVSYEAVNALNGGVTVDIRGQNTPFLTQDAPATTDLDWTPVEINGFETMTWEYRFYQIRIKLNLVEY